jgi:hypothetical protein
MAVESINIQIDKGTDFSQNFVMKNPDQTIIDLTGYTGVSKVRKYPEDTKYVRSFAVGIASTTGTITLSMGTTITSELVVGRNYYDILVTSGSSIVSKVFEGSVMVNATISV